MIVQAALILSFIMAIYLFAFSYVQAIQIAESETEVRGGTFIFSVAMAFIFSGLTYIFI
ncbi:MAG: hypothetical protein ACQEUT_21005 [Bacillota bacterium]